MVGVLSEEIKIFRLMILRAVPPTDYSGQAFRKKSPSFFASSHWRHRLPTKGKNEVPNSLSRGARGLSAAHPFQNQYPSPLHDGFRPPESINPFLTTSMK